jgi:hypothetical protein
MTPSEPNFQHIGQMVPVIVFLFAIRFVLVLVMMPVVKVRVPVI